MTAEIAVINPSGVALAADSAVTISGPLGEKVYNTVNKIFRISDIEPVGAMIHNAAAYAGIPWETLFKDYRARFGGLQFGTLEEYVDDVLEYLADLPGVENGATAILQELMYAYSIIFNQLEAWAKQEFSAANAKPIAANEASKKLIAITEQIVAKQKTAGLFEAVAANTRFPTLRTAQFASHIEKVAQRFFSEDIISPLFISLSKDLAVELARRGNAHGSESGVVIAGFGSDDLFPTVASFDIRSPVDGRARRRRTRVFPINKGQEAAVLPYAQTDVVQTFMDGIHPQMAEYLGVRLGEMIERVGSAVLDATCGELDAEARKDLDRQISESTKDLLESFQGETRQWQSQHISGPVVQAVRHLPLDELAALAESMVTTTALRRRVSMGPETVGGAVDVAVISKGDGLIWMSRKHYFDSALNSHFGERQRLIAAKRDYAG